MIAGWYALCGTKSRCFLAMYSPIMMLVALAQGILTIVFFADPSRVAGQVKASAELSQSRVNFIRWTFVGLLIFEVRRAVGRSSWLVG